MTDIAKKFDLGCEDIDCQRYDDAEKIFMEILQEDPDNFAAINKLGVISAGRNDLDTAMQYFGQALLLNGEYCPALVNLGNIYREQGDYETAEAYYQKSIACDPEFPMAYYNLAGMYKKTKGVTEYMKYMKDYKRINRRVESDKRFLRTKTVLASKKFSRGMVISSVFVVVAILIYIKM